MCFLLFVKPFSERCFYVVSLLLSCTIKFDAAVQPRQTVLKDAIRCCWKPEELLTIIFNGTSGNFLFSLFLLAYYDFLSITDTITCNVTANLVSVTALCVATTSRAIPSFYRIQALSTFKTVSYFILISNKSTPFINSAFRSFNVLNLQLCVKRLPQTGFDLFQISIPWSWYIRSMSIYLWVLLPGVRQLSCFLLPLHLFWLSIHVSESAFRYLQQL